MTSKTDPAEEERHLGYVPGPGELSLEERERVSREENERTALRAAGEAAFPPLWDWRAKDGRNFISAPKDQGSCGACTAFAAASAINAKMRIDLNVATGDPSGGLMPDLSEAQLFFCGSAGNCAAGSNVQVLMDYARDTGVVPDTSDPYDPNLRGCRISVVKDWKSLVTKISGWETLKLKSGGTDAMKEWIATKGPLATAMYPVYEDFRSFKGAGVYKWDGSSPKVNTDGVDQGHAVCVIGYDDARRAWIIKNSWGSGWGSNGFAYVAYGQSGIDAEMWGVAGLSTIYPFHRAAGLPSACVYNGQTHYCYRDADNAIQDAVWTGSGWTIQQVAGPGSASGGPAAAGDPAVVSFNGEMHCFYRALGTDEIWDAEWSGSRWYSFQLTGDSGLTGGPKASGDSNPNVVVYGDQLHCFYRDGVVFAVHEIISGTNWSAGTVASGASSDPALVVHSGAGFNQLHCCYRDSTALHQWKTGNVFDTLYDNNAGKWLTIQVTGVNPVTGVKGKAPGAPEAFGAPSAVVYSDQTHYWYRDFDGVVWDVIQNGDAWTPVRVTGAGGTIPAAPAAAGDPFAIVSKGAGYNQMHCCYRDAGGAIWDAQWTGGDWIATQVTGAGGKIPGAPAAADGPFVFLQGNQTHYCYRDKAGYIQDAVWNGGAWIYQTI